MGKIIGYLDHGIKRCIKYYRKRVFLDHINSEEKSVNILGQIYLNVPYHGKNVKIGKNVTIYPGVYFWGDGEISIGDNVSIGKDTIIYAAERVYIGSDTNIAAQCYIIDSEHSCSKGVHIAKQKDTTSPITIGDDVWIGANVTVLAGSIISSGAVIGAKALVKGRIDENVIAVGIPAKERGKRI